MIGNGKLVKDIFWIVVGSLSGIAWLILQGDTVMRAALALITGFGIARGISGMVSYLRRS